MSKQYKEHGGNMRYRNHAHDGEPIGIAVVSAETSMHDAATRFMDERAFRAHGCKPPRVEGMVLVAYLEESKAVVGTIVLKTSNGNDKFPLEHTFSFEPTPLPVPFDRARFVQLYRWFSSVPHLSHILLYEAGVLATQMQKTWVIAQAKPRIIERLREFDIICHTVSRAQLLLQNISPEERHYYIEPPAPRLIIWDIAQMRDALEQRVALCKME